MCILRPSSFLYVDQVLVVTLLIFLLRRFSNFTFSFARICFKPRCHAWGAFPAWRLESLPTVLTLADFNTTRDIKSNVLTLSLLSEVC